MKLYEVHFRAVVQIVAGTEGMAAAIARNIVMANQSLTFIESVDEKFFPKVWNGMDDDPKVNPTLKDDPKIDPGIKVWDGIEQANP